MMDKLWVVLLVALTGAHLGYGLPVRSTPRSYPHNTNGPILEGWKEGDLYAAVPALALIATAMGFLIGCTWCYRHKDRKQNEGADNQLFTASATHLHERRSHPPDSGFSEPANNNVSEDNNNGPISLREMQNIANNNAAAYIVSENEERNRAGRGSVVEFEPLPAGVGAADPLERCVDWFGDEDFPRNRLQYLREIGRGWFGRVVEGEIEDGGTTTTVAVKILNQNASLEDKARFLDEARLYRDSSHENVLGFVASCLQEDPWMLIFELCSTDLRAYLASHRHQTEALEAAGVPLRLMCDVTAALVYLHARGLAYGELSADNTLVRGAGAGARARLGHYGLQPRPAPPALTTEGDVHALGSLMWDACAWGAPARELACRYRDHLYQVMQLCWIAEAADRPSAGEIHALLEHLLAAHARAQPSGDGYGTSDFERRWQRLKPNHIPKQDEHVAIVHAPSAGSRCSSVCEPPRSRSASLADLHGSLEDCKEASERSDGSVDPWLKDIVAGSQDDVNYYRVVSDVIKNLDNILDSEKTSSSESSHQASPSRDRLSLDCKKDHPMQSSMVKSPGISDFRNILEGGFDGESPEKKRNEDDDGDTIGTLSHSFERHGDTTSRATLENLTPDTPAKDMDLPMDEIINNDINDKFDTVEVEVAVDVELPKENKINNSNSVLPNLADLCIVSISSVNETKNVVNVSEDCQSPGDNNLNDIVRDKETEEAKSISEVIKEPLKSECVEEVTAKDVCKSKHSAPVSVQNTEVLPEVTDTVENDNLKNLLPSNTLTESDVDDSRPDPTSTNSQNERNNDLITPAESTIDRRITQLESASHESESIYSEVNHLDNVREISNGLANNIEEYEEKKSPVSTFETKEAILPEVVQNQSTCSLSPVAHDNVTEGVLHNDILSTSGIVSDSEVPVCKDAEDEFVNFIAKDATEQVQVGKNLETPTLILPGNHDETMSPTSFDKMSEAFVEMIIKEAETAALIEREHSNVPEKDSWTKEGSINDSVENEMKFLESSPINDFAITPELLSDELVKSKVSTDSVQCTFLKEEIKELAKEALSENVPKAKESTELPLFFLESDINKCDIIAPIAHLESTTENAPEITQENKEHTNPQCMEKENDNEILSQLGMAPIALSQVSLDLESTASGDSSQSTFLIKDTLKEESNSLLPEEPASILQDSAEQPQTNTEPISNTFLERDTKLTESASIETQMEKIIMQKADLPNEDEKLKPYVKEITMETPCIYSDVLKSETGVESSSKPVTAQSTTNNSTVYMDLTNSVQADILELSPMEEKIKKVVDSCLETTTTENDCILVRNESTVYLDLPNVIRETDEFLHSERQLSSNIDAKDPLSSSTPKSLAEDPHNSERDNVDALSETKIPDYGQGVTLTKSEQCVPDFNSPFDSPTKSHPTDTYDENSSVVLGPFENCTMELFKGGKLTDLIDIPKEELLAFSSNFSEIDLETPSPLRDVNFLNEVPDIDEQDDASERKELSDPKTEASDATEQSVTERRVSPSTPPNSPGYFLASTSQQKYLVDIDLNQPTEPAPLESDSGLSSLHKEIDLNQIELQITSKLAMAENENNLNIEYSGPLTVEGVVQDEMQAEEESGPEEFLAGNGGCLDDIRERFTLDEDCVNALRNELELKLPLAQVASIEPARETDGADSSEGAAWAGELPPPPELVVSYPGALSPIAEETAPQLSAYESDAPWNVSCRTDSSESYPEPCASSADDASSLPAGPRTYTLPRAPPSTEVTMSADSLEGSPRGSNAIDNRTFTLEDERDACERLSRVSPFVLSPADGTGASTLTTAPDSKPSETRCGSGIDSWCSNDTLYNVEEAFDDLAPDPEPRALERSDSSRTLTDREPPEPPEPARFSPDSITVADEATYTKPGAAPASPPDLACGPSYSNCTAEVLSADNWLLPRPELVRRSPVEPAEITVAPPVEHHELDTEQSPRLRDQPHLKKMDSVEITCLEDHLPDASPKNQAPEVADSPEYRYTAATVTSTPLVGVPADEMEVTPDQMRTPVDLSGTVPNLSSFLFSAELRPQDRSYVAECRPEGSSGDAPKTASDATLSYTEFENAATSKPQDTPRMQSSQNSSDDYRKFESSLRDRPQDISESPSALLLLAERAVATHNLRPSQLPSRSEPNPPKNSRESRAHTVIITDLEEDETEQPHSIIVTEISNDNSRENRTYESNIEGEMNHTYDSHPSRRAKEDGVKEHDSDGSKELSVNGLDEQSHTGNSDAKSDASQREQTSNETHKIDAPNGTVLNLVRANDAKCNGNGEKFAIVNFINESFEELVESNVDDGDCKDKANDSNDALEPSKDGNLPAKETAETPENPEVGCEDRVNGVEGKVVAVTEDFLQNEKRFCQLDSYLPLLSDIRFTGPASEIMSTSFTQESPTEPEERDKTPGGDMKEWDSDTDSRSSNSSSGEFIWKGGDGQETSVVPSTHFDHRGSGGSTGGGRAASRSGSGSGSASGSGSGSEGDEVEFVPSSWDCRAAPGKSSLRRLADYPQDKKRVVFKRQKYHCVYEYPRQLAVEAGSPCLPDLSTYAEWDASCAEEAELGYGQLFAARAPLDLYPRAAFATDYDEDFYITSTARPFERLGALAGASQFFPGRKPDLTPDSGVEDGTPSGEAPAPPPPPPWRADSASSSGSASPGSPPALGGALGGLRHTRDRLKLDLPPSPHAPSPRAAKMFSFALEPTFATFGKTEPEPEREPQMVLTDAEAEPPPEPPAPPTKEATVLDSGDEDSGIESAKATLERNTNQPANTSATDGEP